MDFLRNFFSQTLGLGTQKERLLDELTLEGVSRYMQSERCKSPARTGPLPHSRPPAAFQPQPCTAFVCKSQDIDLKLTYAKKGVH